MWRVLCYFRLSAFEYKQVSNKIFQVYSAIPLELLFDTKNIIQAEN
jgi:hypothetical protein